MKLRNFVLLAGASVFIIPSCFYCAFAVSPEVKSEVILKSTKAWTGKAYEAYPSGVPQVSVLKITIPAHTELPWHTHDMVNVAYVLSGDLTVEEKKTGVKKIYKAGQAVPETVNVIHRGFTGDGPVELIVFYAGEEGLPLSRLSE